MYSIEFHDKADSELREAAQYYEERVRGLGKEFIDEAGEF